MIKQQADTGGGYGAEGGTSPERQQRGAKRGCGNFLRHEIYKNSVSFDGYGRTNHVHRTMHILDVISSVSRSSECNKIVGGWSFAPDPTGGVDSASKTS